MKLPFSLEQIYLSLTTKKSFSSGKEDSLHISQDLREISQFFLQVSQKHGDTRPEDLTYSRLQSLISAYEGPRLARRRIIFYDEVAS